ncbi:MAG: HepT-like ribonuclease domain-containing protein [Rickettsiales bacterium]
MSDNKSDIARLLHVRDAIEQIFLYNEEDKNRGNRTRDAIIRQLEIIGEACNHVSDEIKLVSLQIAWREIIAMRNHLAHGYF